MAWDPASPTIRRLGLPCSCLLYVARRQIALARGVQGATCIWRDSVPRPVPMHRFGGRIGRWRHAE